MKYIIVLLGLLISIAVSVLTETNNQADTLTPIQRQTGIKDLRAEQFVYEDECYNVWRGGTHSGMIGVTKTTCADG